MSYLYGSPVAFQVLCAGHLHVTDFGLAKRLKIGQRTSTICGTLQYIGLLRFFVTLSYPSCYNLVLCGHWSFLSLMMIMMIMIVIMPMVTTVTPTVKTIARSRSMGGDRRSSAVVFPLINIWQDISARAIPCCRKALKSALGRGSAPDQAEGVDDTRQTVKSVGEGNPLSIPYSLVGRWLWCLGPQHLWLLDLSASNPLPYPDSHPQALPSETPPDDSSVT